MYVKIVLRPFKTMTMIVDRYNSIGTVISYRWNTVDYNSCNKDRMNI